MARQRSYSIEFKRQALKGAPGCRRRPALTRNGHDWTERFPLITTAAGALKVRSCLIDGKMVCCGESGCDDQHKSALFTNLR